MASIAEPPRQRGSSFLLHWRLRRSQLPAGPRSFIRLWRIAAISLDTNRASLPIIIAGHFSSATRRRIVS